MSLVGNIKDFTLVQLLSLISRGRKSGCLEIRAGGTVATVHFLEGKLVDAVLSTRQLPLDEALVKAGRLTQEVRQQLLHDYAPLTEKGLALLLEDNGLLSREEALEVVRAQAVDVVQYLFTFQEGDFRFDQGVSAPEERIPLSLGLESMIIEGTRQLEEWDALRDHVPDLRATVRFEEHQAERMKNIQLTGDEWRIITQIDGQSDIQTIAERNGLNDLRIRKVIYGLMIAGLIRLERPSAPVAMHQERVRQAVPSRAVQRSLVVRIINRIRGM